MQRELAELRKCILDKVRLGSRKLLALELLHHRLREHLVLYLEGAPQGRNALREKVYGEL